jgi:hypothetical protein
MLDAGQLANLIIKPALQDLAIFSDDMCQLLLFTCSVESVGGTYIHQVNGPALGIYQLEPATYNDIWTNWIKDKQGLKLQLLHNFNAPVMPDENRLIYDIRFATAMCAIFYSRVHENIPASTFEAMWDYYKRYYNTSKGKADQEHAMNSWLRFKKG